MNGCEACEERISALLDGELDSAEVIEALDHAMACDACRRFYAGARALDRTTRPAGLSMTRTPAEITAVMPPGIWAKIERSGRRPEPVSFRDWGLRAAALVVVAFGLWSLGSLRNATSVPATPFSATPPRDIRLEENRAGMTEARFVEMTTELLRSDRRYHRAMFEVMRDITEATGSEEGSDEEVVAHESEDSEQPVAVERNPRLPG